jgi:transcription initiation factor TFIID TATA-box-binding protein
MLEVNIENIVASTRIAESLDLDKLATSIPDSKYDPPENPLLILHFTNPKSAAMLFSNGKLVLTGPRNMEELEKIIENVIEKLISVGVDTFEKPKVEIRNMVASADIKKHLDLNSIANSMKDAEYVPERFPGLIRKMENVVILLFSTGKIVCNGKEKEEISTAVNRMTEELSSLK